MQFKLTFTGVDSLTNFDKLAALSVQYPFIEWGILYSKSRAGNDPRYPSLDFIEKFLQYCETNIPHTSIALHLCGTIAEDIITHGFSLDDRFLELIKKVNRIQLNINSANMSNYYSLFAQEHFIAGEAHYWQKPFIVQYNKNNQQLVDKLLQLPRQYIHILKDSSAGTGKFLEDVTIPRSCISCPLGFAGGYGPENIEIIAPKIYDSVMSQNVEGGNDNGMFWLDMESKVRTNDVLDVDKVEFVVSKIHQIYFNSYRSLEI